MKITYTGRKVELSPLQLKKVTAKFAKVGKLLDGKEEREAHVIVSQERRLNKVEATVHYHGHELVGIGSDDDLLTAIQMATDKLEKQAIKVRAKWRDSRRAGRKVKEAVTPAAAAPAAADETPARQIFRVNGHARRKPITLDEAILLMEKDRDYLVYRDASTERTSVLLRRRDGNFDLVEY